MLPLSLRPRRPVHEPPAGSVHLHRSAGHAHRQAWLQVFHMHPPNYKFKCGVKMFDLTLVSNACHSPNQNEINTCLVARQTVRGDDALTRPPTVAFLQTHLGQVSRSLFTLLKRGRASKIACRGPRGGGAKGRRGERAKPKTEWSKKAAARTVFSTISHQITPSKHTHGTTFLVLKSLGAILCNNPPLKTSVPSHIKSPHPNIHMEQHF